MANAFGHGLGADQAEPINFEGMNVTVRTELSPVDITVGKITDANLEVRFFDLITDKNLDFVTYRIEVNRGDDLLAREYFYDKDGSLDVEIRPVLSCAESDLWRCTDYYGERHAISGGLIARGDGRPIIQGPIFDKGGLYNFKVTIEGATSPKTLVSSQLEFETFVSVAQEQDFVIQTAQAQQIPLIVKTYYDDITSLEYSSNDDSISFEMPFDWNPDYISQVQVVHQELRIPKSFDPYNQNANFKGYVNGVEVSDRVLILDPYTFEDENTLHFLVTGTELDRINEQLGPSNYDSQEMLFKLVPQGQVVKNSAKIQLTHLDTGQPVGAIVGISWDSRYGLNDEIPVEFTFFDENNNLLKDIKYAYILVDEDNKIIQSGGDDPENLGIDASEGIDTQKIIVPTQNKHRLDVWLLGQGISLTDTYTGKGSTIIEVGPSSSSGIIKEPTTTTTNTPSTLDTMIPSWVKTNAKLWSDGTIDDQTFVSGIEYMIQKDIIVVPQTSSDNKDGGVTPTTPATTIPSWVKTNAKLWSDGTIDDQTFASGLQWLIINGIIII